MAKGIPRSSTTGGWPRPGSYGVSKPSPADVHVPPMPTTRGAGRDLPNGMNTFIREIRPPARMGELSINPGRPAGKK